MRILGKVLGRWRMTLPRGVNSSTERWMIGDFHRKKRNDITHRFTVMMSWCFTVLSWTSVWEVVIVKKWFFKWGAFSSHPTGISSKDFTKPQLEREWHWGTVGRLWASWMSGNLRHVTMSLQTKITGNDRKLYDSDSMGIWYTFHWDGCFWFSTWEIRLFFDFSYSKMVDSKRGWGDLNNSARS